MPLFYVGPQTPVHGLTCATVSQNTGRPELRSATIGQAEGVSTTWYMTSALNLMTDSRG